MIPLTVPETRATARSPATRPSQPGTTSAPDSPRPPRSPRSASEWRLPY